MVLLVLLIEREIFRKDGWLGTNEIWIQGQDLVVAIFSAP